MAGQGRTLAAAGLLAAAAAALAAAPLGPALERDYGRVLLLRLRGPVEPPPDVVIVAQDHASAKALGLRATLYGWPREHLAAVVRNATAAGARVVALDLILEAAREPAGDDALEAALRESGRAVLFERLGRQPAEGAEGVVAERVIPVLPRFADAAYATAPLPLPEDGSPITEVWSFKRGAEGRPTLPAATLLAAAFLDPEAAAMLGERAGAAAAPLPFQPRVAALRRAAKRGGLGPPQAEAPTGGGARLAAAAWRLLAGPDSHLLKPYGPAGAVPRVSYHRIARGEPEALAALRGRVVLVGASDLTEQASVDTFRTAFDRPDGINPAGVEIAATACLNLLDGDIARPAPRIVEAGAVAGAAALAAGATALLPPALAVAGVLAAGAAAAAGALAALQASGLALPVASVLALSLPLGLLAGLLARHGILRRQLDRAVAFLTHGKVRRARPLDPLTPAGVRRRRWAVCLATDLAGFVGLTEEMRQREAALAGLLADYRGVLQEAVERQGGTVLGFAGDASMCVWESDAPGEEPRRRAVTAALDLVRELDAFALRRGLRGHPTRVGLAAGEIILGNVAAGDRFDFGAVGEPLNVASRLEQLNKQLGTRILATAGVIEGLSGVRARRLGSLRLRGRGVDEEIVALDPAPPGP